MAYLMTTKQTGYRPINCEFHDLLEDLATLRKAVRMSFRSDHDLIERRDSVITDVFSRAGAEYLSLTTRETVRLDRIIEVGGACLAEHEETSICAL
jgi:Rho-binding antiterminator